MCKNFRKYALRVFVALLVSSCLIGGLVAATGIYDQVVIKATPDYVPVSGNSSGHNPGPAGDGPKNVAQPLSFIFVAIGVLMVAGVLTTFPANPIGSIMMAAVIAIITAVEARVIQDMLNAI